MIVAIDLFFMFRFFAFSTIGGQASFFCHTPREVKVVYKSEFRVNAGLCPGEGGLMKKIAIRLHRSAFLLSL